MPSCVQARKLAAAFFSSVDHVGEVQRRGQRALQHIQREATETLEPHEVQVTILCKVYLNSKLVYNTDLFPGCVSSPDL